MRSRRGGARASRRGTRRALRMAAACGALACALLGAGCGRRAAPTQPAAAPLPPTVTALSPPPRSVGVPYDSLDIWAQFAEPLDPNSVSTTTVFLKIDTVRQPITVSWDAGRNRIVVRVNTTVQLQQTYTVVLSPNLRSAAGVPLGTSCLWQFTVNSVRRPRWPSPQDGQENESPFVALTWTGNSSADGPAVYEVYAGTDSTAVAARTAPRIYSGPLQTRFLPHARWPQDHPVYWAVNTVSPTTGESLPGPVWRFTTDPPTTPVDSIEVPLDFCAYGYQNEWGWSSSVCRGTLIMVGTGYNAGVSWDLSAIPGGSHLAGARMFLSALGGFEGQLAAGALTLWYATSNWTCTRTYLYGPPSTDESNGQVAVGYVDVPGVARCESDTLTAYLESCVRYTGLRGFVLRSRGLLYLASQADPPRKPRLTVYVYRRSAALASRPVPSNR
jgi:hypothetical protein